MADEFAAAFKAMIDGWMTHGLEPYVNLIAALALAARAAVLLIFRNNNR